MTNHKITIKNLGPIKEINNFEIKKINFLTGKSGTGKSLICKAIYCFNGFFNSFCVTNTSFNDEIEDNLRHLLKRFFDDYNKYIIKYYYSGEYFIEIEKKDQNQIPKIKFSEQLINQIKEIDKINLDEEKLIESNLSIKNLVINRLIDILNIKNILFIPATRSFIFDFQDVINNLLNIYNKSITSDQFDLDLVHFVTRWSIYSKKFKDIHPKFKDILRGEIKIDLGRVSFKPNNSNEYLTESSISSGQKEVIPIAVILSKLLEKKEECLLIIEEPESNLFPEDQLKLLEFLVFFTNETNSKLLITSHSPYFCGLADAILVEDKKDNKLIDPKEFSANYIDNGKLISIFDKEDKEVNIDYIDSASDLISDKYRVNKGDER